MTRSSGAPEEWTAQQVKQDKVLEIVNVEKCEEDFMDTVRRAPQFETKIESWEGKTLIKKCEFFWLGSCLLLH